MLAAWYIALEVSKDSSYFQRKTVSQLPTEKNKILKYTGNTVPTLPEQLPTYAVGWA